MTAVAKTGAFIGFDTVGHQMSQSHIPERQKVARVMQVLEAGYEDHLLLSGDFAQTHNLKANWGNGFSSVVLQFVPKLRHAGVKDSTLAQDSGRQSPPVPGVRAKVAGGRHPRFHRAFSTPRRRSNGMLRDKMSSDSQETQDEPVRHAILATCVITLAVVLGALQGSRPTAGGCRAAVHRTAHCRRQAESERHLAGDELGALGPRAALGRGRHSRPGWASSKADTIPYLPAALAKRNENYGEPRRPLDPVSKCYLPGVPRITYMPFPFQIAQTPKYIVITYECPHATRIIYTDGSQHVAAQRLLDGRLARALGEGHAGRRRHAFQRQDLVRHGRQLPQRRAARRRALHAARSRPCDATTKRRSRIPKVFTRPWKISMPIYRRAEKNLQILDYDCVDFSGVGCDRAGEVGRLKADTMCAVIDGRMLRRARRSLASRRVGCGAVSRAAVSVTASVATLAAVTALTVMAWQIPAAAKSDGATRTRTAKFEPPRTWGDPDLQGHWLPGGGGTMETPAGQPWKSTSDPGPNAAFADFLRAGAEPPAPRPPRPRRRSPMIVDPR